MQKENLKKGQKEQKRTSLETKKEIAKIGMTASMGIVVGTSFFMKNKLAKRAHIVAGGALVGFSLWHHLLYQPEQKSKKEDLKETKPAKIEESKNISLHNRDNFTELKISKEFDTKDLDTLKELVKDIKHPSLLIRMPKIENKKVGLWNKFLDTIKKSSQVQKCAIYSIGMKKYLKNRPKEWQIVATYKGSKELLRVN